MPNIQRLITQLLAIYIGVLGALVLGCGYVLTRVIADEELSRGSGREPSILDHRIQTARQIKETLAKPQRPIEPLPPITVKIANSRPAKSAAGEKPKTLKLAPPPLKFPPPPEARDAMAMDNSWGGHSSKAYDRAGNVGW
jgi:hypothetical protein